MENSLTIENLVSMFDEAEETSYDARIEAERARDYVDGRQLTAEEEAELKRRGQPAVVINRIRRKVEWLKGLEIKQRTDPKAFPREPKHEQGAEAATDALRFVADNTDLDEHRSMVWENMLVEGFGGLEVVHKQKKNGQVDIVVNHYAWDRLFYDPHSRKHDFSDAEYLGAMVWQDKKRVMRDHPKAAVELEALADEEKGVETYDDRPRFGRWFDGKRDRLRVVLIWYRDGDIWRYCRFCKSVKLEEGESPYVDEEGESVCPLILQSAYVGRNNDRYGIVRDMFSPQDEINKRRSKALHALNTRQVIIGKGTQTDLNRLRREVARPDGIIEIDDPDGVFRIETNGELASGQASLLQEAKQEMDLMGANSALEGETGESSSGRAVLARQQGGMIEIASLMNRLHHFTRRVYAAMWQRIRQFWTEEKWVRITDDERNVRFVGLNRPITLQEQLAQLPEEQVVAYARQLGLRPGDPRLQAVVGVDNQVEQIAVDIILDEVPDRVTLQGEAFEALTKYAQNGMIPPQVLIEADPTLPASKKEKLLEMMQQQAQQPNPAEKAELDQMNARAAKDAAQAQKYQAEAASRMPLGFASAAGA